jgi:hypothetical protein
MRERKVKSSHIAKGRGRDDGHNKTLKASEFRMSKIDFFGYVRLAETNCFTVFTSLYKSH